MRAGISAAGAALLLLFPTAFPHRMEAPAAAGTAVASPRFSAVVEGVIDRNMPLAATLSPQLSPAGVHELVTAARPVYDLHRVMPGQPFTLALDGNGKLAQFEYSIDDLRTLRVERDKTGLNPRLLTRRYDSRVATVSGTITSSLFAAVNDTGEEDQLALDLAEIFAWDVDFHTDIQKGDAFRVAVEKLSLDGRFVRYGRIVAAEFTRGPRTFQAIHFEGEKSQGYYAADGTPLRKAFLRSPLKFSRISSGFSRARLHPVLKVVRRHLGVDYAAPTGTPVMAAGDGVVSLAGWSGGYGKTVKIRHPNGYETLYGHLSRIYVKQGQRVVQGVLVGAVGSTGLATGPHLDYRMIRAGVFVNPLKVQSPPAEPIPPAERPEFESLRTQRLAFLGTAAPVTVAEAAQP